MIHWMEEEDGYLGVRKSHGLEIGISMHNHQNKYIVYTDLVTRICS